MVRYIKQPSDTRFTIVQDDREKQPWIFSIPTKIKRLKVGDYTIQGYESIITIEKKSGIGELLNDLAVSYRPTFKRFLAKMQAHPVRVIVVQEELTEYNVKRALKVVVSKSRGRCRLTEQTIYHWVSEITMTYGIPILFLDWRVKDTMLPQLFQAAYKKAQEVRR